MAVRSGGMRFTPVDINNSVSSGTTVYDDEKAFSAQLKDFFRMDVRVFWRRNKPNFTRTFSLDIRNLTNHKNTAHHYYDEQKKKVVIVDQLGIIPFLSYRVEF